MVVKEHRRGCPWLVRRAEEPWPPTCGGGMACFLAVLKLVISPTSGIWSSCGPFTGGIDPSYIVCSLLFFQGLSM
jgi:hypothetical protein